MATGIVKWFNSAKGYGFISADGSGQDVFAHFSSIIMEGYKSLKAGQAVTFEINEGPKGLHAAEIRPKDMLDDDVTEREEQTREHAVEA